MVNAAFVKQIAPELSDQDDTTIDFWITQAKLSVSEKYWAAKYDLGVAVLTAHYLTLRKPGSDNSGVTGALTQEKVGDLSRSYSSAADHGVDSSLATTSYGIWFVNLKKQVITTPQIV